MDFIRKHQHYCWSCKRTWECHSRDCHNETEVTCPLCDKELDADEEE